LKLVVPDDTIAPQKCVDVTYKRKHAIGVEIIAAVGLWFRKMARQCEPCSEWGSAFIIMVTDSVIECERGMRSEGKTRETISHYVEYKISAWCPWLEEIYRDGS
jgi:hypothetical protein